MGAEGVARGGRRTQAERREATRAALLATGAATFEELGYHGASVDLIAKRAGYTKGAAYGHFPSKEDLFLAVYDERIAERAALVAGLARAGDSPGGALRDAVEGYARVLAENRAWTIVLIEFTAHAARRPQLLARLQERDAFLRRAVAEAVAPLAAHAGVVSEQYADAALLVVSGMMLEQAQDPARPAPRLASAVAGAVHSALSDEIAHG